MHVRIILLPRRKIRIATYQMHEPHCPLTRETSVLCQTAAHGCPWQKSRTDAFSKTRPLFRTERMLLSQSKPLNTYRIIITQKKSFVKRFGKILLTAMVRHGIIVTEYATRRTVASTLIHNERRLIIMATYVSLSDIISIISMLTQIITLCYVVFKNNRHK